MEAGAGNGARALVRCLSELPGKLRTGVRLAELTTFRIGGPAWAVFQPATSAALIEAIALARSLGIPWKLLGGGSNVLFPDHGFPGLILNTRLLRNWTRAEDLLIAEAGLPLSWLAWQGFPCVAGIPGTLGGGLAMNAGTRAGEIGERVAWVEVLMPDGKLCRLTRGECGFAYRDSRIKRLGWPVLRAGLIPLKGGDVGGLLASRVTSQPLAQPSAGCVFRNPAQAPAGWLIDKAGLKGARSGDAMVSQKHANFIVNLGRATAQDVLALVDRIRSRVYRIFKVWLELELEIVTP